MQYPVHCKLFSSYLLDASNIALFVAIKNVPRYCQMRHRGHIGSQLTVSALAQGPRSPRGGFVCEGLQDKVICGILVQTGTILAFPKEASTRMSVCVWMHKSVVLPLQQCLDHHINLFTKEEVQFLRKYPLSLDAPILILFLIRGPRVICLLKCYLKTIHFSQDLLKKSITIPLNSVYISRWGTLVTETNLPNSVFNGIFSCLAYLTEL